MADVSADSAAVAAVFSEVESKRPGQSEGEDVDTPLPMRLPQSVMHARVKQLLSGRVVQSRASSKREQSDPDAMAKRRRRRYDNATLRFNPHATPAAERDLFPGRAAEEIFPTFPAPPPRGFASANSDMLPTSRAEQTRTRSMEDSGRFNTSLKGVRRAVKPMVRGECGRAYEVIKAVEAELSDWLDASHVWPGDDFATASRTIFEPAVDEDVELESDAPDLSVHVVSRTPSNMVLRVADALNRFLVHSVARFWSLTSFSKTTPDGDRLTWLLRPYTPLRDARASLATPPTTDLASSVAGSEFDSESEAGSLSEDGWTDLGPSAAPRHASLERVQSRSSAEGDVESALGDEPPSLASSFASLDLAETSPRRGRTRALDSRSNSPSPSRYRRRGRRRPQMRATKSLHRKAWSPPRTLFLEYLLM